MRWRTFGESVCVCSFYAPHPGIDVNVRVAFWQELTATVRDVRSTVDLPMVIAGDANVWLPYFSLGRSRSVDKLVVPFIDLLISSCGLRLPSHPRGWGCSRPYVDLFPLPLFDVGPQWVAMLRGSSWLLPHNGFRPLPVRGICFIDSQACSRPVSTSALPAQLVLNSTPCIWDLCTWSGRVFSCLQGPTPDCPALCLDVVDQLYDQLLSVLSWHSPRPRMVPRRRQPSWWTHECYSACVARNGAWRDYRRDPNPMLHARFRAARLAFHSTVRSVRRSYWSQWQSRVTSLSESQPRLAASVIRHTFRGPALLMETLAFRSRKCWTIGGVTLLLLGPHPPPLALSTRTFMQLFQLGSSLSVLFVRRVHGSLMHRSRPPRCVMR